MLRSLALALAGFLLLTAAAAARGASTALECGRPIDQARNALCSTPALNAADAATAFAQKDLERGLTGSARAALRLDQAAWVRARDGSCGAAAPDARLRCLLAETEARRRMLSGGGRNRDRGAPRVDPVFFHEARAGRYQIEIAYPQIVGAKTAAQIAFNKAAHDLILGDAGLMHEFRQPGSNGAPTLNVVFYDIHYVGPRLATVIFWLLSGSRQWQHPFIAREVLVFDLAHGKALRPEDVVAAPASALAKISTLCRSELAKTAAAEGWKPLANADPALVVADFQNWAPGPFALDILYDPGSIAAAATGPHACRLDYPALLPLLKLQGPLPPH